MRLLHVHSLVIREIPRHNVPPYAILSHTWGEEEVSFQNLVEHKAEASALRGYKKIMGCCKQASLDGFEYVWIDTCCIDKRSSSEVSEAINSMFRWYQNASLCYAYLEDVNYFSNIQTLQELIAPPLVIFYSTEWSPIGTRDALKDTITRATHIDSRAFYPGNLNRSSVAQKMSWASNRTTQKLEDEAENAFRRLQEEIVKQSDDETIFAWYTPWQNGSLLAASPSGFESSGSIERFKEPDNTRNGSPYTITNKGIQISLPMIYRQSLGPPVVFLDRQKPYNETFIQEHPLAILNCHVEGDQSSYVAVFLSEHGSTGTYSRKADVGLVSIPTDYITKRAAVRQILVRAGQPESSISWISCARLVVVQPFPTSSPNLIFEKILSLEGSRAKIPYFHDNGALSVYLQTINTTNPTFSDSKDSDLKIISKMNNLNNPVVLMFKRHRRYKVLIPLAVTDVLGITAAITRTTNSSTYSKIKMSERSGVVGDVFVSVRDAEHGSIVTIQAERRLIR
ncbi:heterokaryon incompatibility protein-domain-containing protein [Xylariaceae sp. FL1651]|nr:heterokaryon incompatibility protein-domain-containing protein [Xylariaceae sp. FL1651]